MNPALVHLKDLAVLDGKLARFRKRRDKQDGNVQAARTALEEAKTHLDDRGKAIVLLQKEADAFNLEAQTAEGEVERLSGQLTTAKSNKEYDVLNREVTAAKKQKSQFEDEVLERLESADTVADEKKAAQAAVETAEAAVKTALAEAVELDKELSGDEKALTDRRDAAISKLDKETRRNYEALLVQRGSAIAKVHEGSCSGCARKLSPQMEVLMDIGNEIVQCMSCQRILYAEPKVEDDGP
jgi:hypothetical protein